MAESVAMPVVNERVCEFYLMPRGCIKGDKCDFAHPPGRAPAPAEDGAPTERVCEFYIQPRGCVKGDKCDFLHPTAPGGGVTNKVCEYFQKPRGCIKGDTCDFLHPNLPASRMAQMSQMGQQGKPVCNFFNSPRGCVKGDKCDFMHPSPYGAQGMGVMGMGMGGMGGGMGGGRGGNDMPKICEFFMTPRGCAKGNSCDFAHLNPAAMQAQQMYGGGNPMAGGMGGFGAPQQGAPGRMAVTPMGPVNRAGKLMRDKVCEFFSSERGCIKGEMCEFIHQKQKPCEFYATSRGCRKGKFCDFVHEGPGGEDLGAGKIAKPSAAATTRYAPY